MAVTTIAELEEALEAANRADARAAAIRAEADDLHAELVDARARAAALRADLEQATRELAELRSDPSTHEGDADMRDPDARHKVPAAKTVDAGRSHDHAIDPANLGGGFEFDEADPGRGFGLEDAQAPTAGEFTTRGGKHVGETFFEDQDAA